LKYFEKGYGDVVLKFTTSADLIKKQ